MAGVKPPPGSAVAVRRAADRRRPRSGGCGAGASGAGRGRYARRGRAPRAARRRWRSPQTTGVRWWTGRRRAIPAGRATPGSARARPADGAVPVDRTAGPHAVVAHKAAGQRRRRSPAGGVANLRS